MSLFVPPIYGLADRMNLTPLMQLAARPDVIDVYRVIVYSMDQKVRNSVATLYHQTRQKHHLEVVYEGLFEHKPLHHAVDESDYESFVGALRHVKFDSLRDQQDLPLHNSIFWLLERAAGTYQKGVLFSPQKPEKPYSTLVNAIDAYLPEAIREVTL